MRQALGVCLFLSLPAVAAAQDWNFDARNVGLGGAGSSKNIATDLIEEERGYRAIVLPFGLFQVLRDFDIYKPDSPKFDPVRAVEYAASPIHFIPERDSSATGQAFVSALRNATFSRDLNTYRGFAPANEIIGGGLANPSFGGTIKVAKRPDGSFHGVYVGAGPYMAIRTTTNFDPQLTSLLASATPVVLRNAQLPVTNANDGQFAIAITGGYRGRMAWSPGIGSGSEREGLYLAANYNYLHGMRYENINLALRFDTDQNGLLTLVPNRPSPLIIDRREGTSGSGFSIDVGIGAVVDRWEVGFGVTGIANRIEWDDVMQTRYSLPNILSGNSDFIESPQIPIGIERVELPVDYRGDIAYRTDEWRGVVQIGHGIQGGTFHGGVERVFDRIAVRGGGRYTLKKWNPTAGVGFNLTPRFGIDVAAFGTTANIERRRKLAIATSLRFGVM
jgi:hypothetical protein